MPRSPPPSNTPRTTRARWPPLRQWTRRASRSSGRWPAVGDNGTLLHRERGAAHSRVPPILRSLQGGGAGGNSNNYVVTVEASDGGSDTTATEELTIEVTNVEEPGTVMLSTLQPQVAVAIIATLTDPDTIEGDRSDHRHLAVVQGQQRDRRSDRWRRRDHVLLHSHDRGT